MAGSSKIEREIKVIDNPQTFDLLSNLFQQNFVKNCKVPPALGN